MGDYNSWLDNLGKACILNDNDRKGIFLGIAKPAFRNLELQLVCLVSRKASSARGNQGAAGLFLS